MRLFSGSPSWCVRNRAASIGVMSRATASDSSTANTAVQPNCLKINPGMPPIIAVGRNTATSVMLVAIDGESDFGGRIHRGLQRRFAAAQMATMFSTSTIASSTNRPITSDSASSVTVFIEKPSQYIAANVGMIDNGNADADTSVARQSRRNSQTTAIARIAPSHSMFIDAAYSLRIMSTESLTSVNLHARVCCAERVDRLRDGVCDGHSAGTARALNLHRDDRLAVEQRELRTVGNGVGDRRDLVEPHVAAVGERDIECVQFAGAIDGCERAHRLARIADFAAATRQLLLDATQLTRHLGRAEIQRRELRRIEFDAHFAIDAADARHLADARHGQQLARHGVVDEPRQRFFVHAIRRHRERQDRLTGRVHFADDRLFDFARQIGADVRYRRAHVVRALRTDSFRGGT